MIKTKQEIKSMLGILEDESDIIAVICELFKATENLEEVKKIYKVLAFLYHPDVNKKVSDKVMKEINNFYDDNINRFKEKDSSKKWKAESEQKEADIFKDIIEKLIKLECDIEICGIFVWVTFDGKPEKETIELLKSLDMKWHPSKKKWYYRPSWYRRGYADHEWSMDEIRTSYGSETVKSKESKNTSSNYNYTKRKKSSKKRKPQLTFTRV